MVIYPGILITKNFKDDDTKDTKKEGNSKKDDTKKKDNKDTKDTTNDTKKEEPKKQVNDGFYIGKDGLFHCNKCGKVPTKEEYNSGECNGCIIKEMEKDERAHEAYEKEMEEKNGSCMYCGCYLTDYDVEKHNGVCEDCWIRKNGDY